MINSITSQALNQAYSGNQLINYHKTEKTLQAASTEQTDRVSISEAAHAKQRPQGLENAARHTEPEGKKLLSEKQLSDRLIYMLNNVDQVEAEFKHELQQMLSLAGIDCSEPIKLTTGRDGHVLVQGDHPDKAQIEEFFKDHPEMRNRFVEISVHKVLKRALDAHLEFIKEYEKDPEAAVAKYFPLFEMIKREGYTMTVGGEPEPASSVA